MIETAKSIVKILLHPRRATVKSAVRPQPLIILGNGPSLRQTLNNDRIALERHPLLAVNFFGNTPEFRELKPEYYVLTDPHFFSGSSDPNLKSLNEAFKAVDWPMTLFLPFGATAAGEVSTNRNIRIERYPLTAVEGTAWIERVAYNARIGMPRPRNVLITSTTLGVWLGFREIYIVGADHSWSALARVDSENRVVSVQPHFYKDNEHFDDLVKVTFLNVRFHELCENWRVAFRSYHQIRRWADSIGVRIYNSTPESFIDAFDRKPLPHE